MRTVSDALAAAIEAPERTTQVRLSLDFDGDGHGGDGSIDDLSGTAASVQVESVLSTNLPEQVTVVEGTAAATLTADLAGGDSDDERLGAVRYFSATSTTSPLAGKQRLGRDVEADVAFLTADGWQTAPLLRGTVRAMPVSVGQRRAQLDAVDRRDRLRSLVQLPVMVADAPIITGSAPIKPGLEGSWAVSYVLAQCGQPLAPPPTSACRLYVPFHGSAMPFVASPFLGSPTAYRYNVTDQSEHQRMRFEPGPFFLGSGRCAEPFDQFCRFTATSTGAAMFASDGRSSGRIELWIRLDGTEWNDHATITVQTETLDQSVYFLPPAYLELSNGGSTRTATGPIPPADGQWHRVGVHWDDAAGRAVFIADDAQTLATFTPTTASAGVVDEWADVTVTAIAPIAELHISTGLSESDAWRPRAWDPGWTVDRSALRKLDGIVLSDRTEGWAILQELAAAEQGAVYFDAGGGGHYATRARLVTSAAQTPQRVITAAAHILELAQPHSVEQVRNVVTGPYNPIAVTMRGKVWQLGETIALVAGETRTLTVTASLATAAFGSVLGHANTASNGTGTQTLVDSDGVPVEATLTAISATAVSITLYNRGAVTVWLVDTSGQPDLYLEGDTVSQGSGADPHVHTNQASVDAYGERPLDVTSNRWVQRRSVGAGLAIATALDLGEPRPVVADLEIPGDPRLEPYDRLTLRDPDNTGLDTDIWYLGGRHTIDASGQYVQAVTGRATRDRYLAGVGLVGEDLVG